MCGKSLNRVERAMQLCINNIQNQVSEKGLRFLLQRQCAYTFTSSVECPHSQVARLDWFLISKWPLNKPYNLLSKSSWHSASSGTNWLGSWLYCPSAPGSITSNFSSLQTVHSKLDYRCIVYGSARQTIQKQLDLIQGLSLIHIWRCRRTG